MQENQNINKDSIKEKIVREFKLTSLALRNKTTVLLLTFSLAIFGLVSYNTLPKELFPEVELPWIMVMTPYPGNAPLDIENLVTRPIEKELETINGIKDIKSTSSQGFSYVLIVFNSGIDNKVALQDCKDAVDDAMDDLPDDLPSDPVVQDIDASEFPVVNINLSGDYSIDELKKYGEILEDRIEALSEISKVEIQGINEKEIKVNADPLKMAAHKVSFNDIENAIAYENMSISSGEIKLGNTRRSIRALGEFTSVSEIENIIVKSEEGKIVYLYDIAEVVDGYEEPSSITRLNEQPVISLQVIKKGGENLLNATAQIDDILKEIRADHIFPEALQITITNDQSDMVKAQLNSLENSMIMSMLFVILVLFFFLGTRNALFVGLAIPLSMFLSFVVLQIIGYTINMMVLFGLILALGMLVDNAIVVVENIYRFIDKGYRPIEAARRAVGEIAVAIIASTLTTLAAFFPLVFWDSVMGEFMKYLPITLIIVLSSSLFVALVIIPVFSSMFIKHSDEDKIPDKFIVIRIVVILVVLGILSYVLGLNILGSLLFIAAFVSIMNYLFFAKIGIWFKTTFLDTLERIYVKFLTGALTGKRPRNLLLGTILLLFLTIAFYFMSSPNMVFFPSGDPNFINVFVELPAGTHITATDKFAKTLEKDIIRMIEPYKGAVKSVLTNVGDGARLEDDLDFSTRDNKCLVTVSFVDYEDRGGVKTAKILKLFNDSLTYNYPGAIFTIDRDSGGPPTGKPINLEISGYDFNELVYLADTIEGIIEREQIEGIEGLKMDLNVNKPEMIVTIDREKVRRFGMSTAQVSSALRTALFGKEVSDYKIGEDKYPIQLRLKEEFRNSIPALMNQKIVFRDNMGKLMQIPISAVASFTYTTTYDAVKRIDLDRVVTLYSNVVEGYNANNVNNEIKAVLEDFEMPTGYEYKFTGEQEEQAESMEFLSFALGLAIALILIILVSQFNSIVKPFIIIASVLFSTIGVFGGLATFKMDFVVIMTGIGIVSLAGVVVNNAIVLIDYIELLKNQKRAELGLGEKVFLPVDIATECIVLAGKTRLRPVLLTAITTVLGLFPMAIGIDIDFWGLLSSFEPNISFGGDMAAMWSPMSWTVIFGLTFATFLTLIIVPVMYRIAVLTKKKMLRIMGKM
ncbi:efflux RND transporter permease subunit [Plebeiibacterium sediminum]|uniref:Efflux RND transporter permease subunit n=1 Tax=Plebeiibacterium sediminum TaxID=2992112 RepID=A0AAE3M0V0_9BACT|nr:efflux RND transporter permease subunit [Plebeiobacterium sediminum]MCW3784984.1 efflux RND transporter permease subunit [Plebeiobacterium sediminum]